MYTRICRHISCGLLTAGLTILVALSGCGDPGTSFETEKQSDADSFASHTDLATITDAAEKAAAETLKAAGAEVFLDKGSVTDVDFPGGGCDDAMAANLAKTPNVLRVSFGDSPKVTDASVATFSNLKQLQVLSIQKTGISGPGAKKIQAALSKDAMVNHAATGQAMRRSNPASAPTTGGSTGGGGGGRPGGGRPGGP